jgi:hypothetical protein
LVQVTCVPTGTVIFSGRKKSSNASTLTICLGASVAVAVGIKVGVAVVGMGSGVRVGVGASCAKVEGAHAAISRTRAIVRVRSITRMVAHL